MCLPSALRLHHHGLSKMKDSGVRVPRNFFHSSHSNEANEEQKENQEERGGGGKSIYISICEMCQTPILFAQCNNFSAKTSRGGTKI